MFLRYTNLTDETIEMYFQGSFILSAILSQRFKFLNFLYVHHIIFGIIILILF